MDGCWGEWRMLNGNELLMWELLDGFWFNVGVICIKTLCNIETNIRSTKEKINVEVLDQKVENLSVQINYMNLRPEILEGKHQTFKGKKIIEDVEEACKADSLDYNHNDETIIPISIHIHVYVYVHMYIYMYVCIYC